jgi:hypothetical protein
MQPTMWTEEATTRIYFSTTLIRATNLLHITIDPSLTDIISIMGERSGLQEAYHDMEDEIDEFINFDEKFVEQPKFKLLALARTMGDSVDETLSMSTKYLGNISDIDDVFQDSIMTCLELSSLAS